MSLVGALLGGYRITEELSSGGMGTIYRARHELLGRDAAVKVVRAELTEDPELVDRFFIEARAATAVRHPSITEVFDFGYTPAGEAYLVMEFLEGETLLERLKRVKPAGLPQQEAASIARALALALVAAHGKGIVHRDLKPANIFLVPDPEQPYGVRVKILDFGIAKLVDPSGAPLGRKHTMTGTLIGTPRYMAPEQARSASTIDQRADQYSLGCILYEMLVGEAPFPKGGSGEVIAMHLFGEVTPPSQRVPELAAGLEVIVMRLLQKAPTDRYAHAAELAGALAGPAGAVLVGPAASATRARPQPWTGQPSTQLVAPMPDRKPLRPIIAAIGALVIAGGLTFAIARKGTSAAQPAPVEMQAERPPSAVAGPLPPPPRPRIVDAGVAEPPPPPPTRHTVTAHTPPKVPQKLPSCDHAGPHTASCAPIETTP
ncbi:hypothetical protein BH11MYX1_BH11MYX1_39980 [soil metagenome]